MSWCLTKNFADKFRKALKDGTIDPVKMANMSSAARRTFLEGYVGVENAQNVNALFESKLLLKNQKIGMITWAKKVVGITPQRRTDLLSRIERLDRVLDPAEGEQFLADLAAARLKVEVTQEEAKQIAEMSKATSEAKAKADKNGEFPSEETRLDYGTKAWVLNEYVKELKLDSKITALTSTKAQKIKYNVGQLPSVAKSIRSTGDNSFFGRQGIKVLTNPKTSKIWVRNFVKSWNSISKELRGIDAMAGVQADIISRPNSVNGKFAAGGFGLNVLSEEAFPVSLEEKIPVFKRLFAASESAYNGGALEMRADLADYYIRMAEEQGVNMLSKEDAKPIGRMVSSQTGRGSLGRAEVIAKEANILFFSVKFAKSNFDVLFAPAKLAAKKLGIGKPVKSKGESFALKEAAKATANILAVQSGLLLIAKLLCPDCVDEDPRSTNFGKIKIYGRWTDITGGMAGVARLAARLTPTLHDGEWGLWRKNQSGLWKNMWAGGFGSDDGADLLMDFVSGKLSPFAKTVFFDTWLKGGRDFYGEPIGLDQYIKNLAVPLPVENAIEMLKDPNAEGVILGIILDGLGFSTSTNIQPNKTTGVFETDKIIKAEDFMSKMEVYARAYGSDPVTAANRLFTGQKIIQISPNNIIVVERDENWAERKSDYAKRFNVNEKDIKEVREEHLVPIAAGGSDIPSNRQMISKSLWSEFTKVDFAYIKALKEKRIKKAEGEKLILDYKRSRMNGSTNIKQEDILNKLQK